MEQTEEEEAVTDAIGHQCRLLKPIRDGRGRSHFDERPRIVREVFNLGRRMFLVRFADGTTTFLFPHEFALG